MHIKVHYTAWILGLCQMILWVSRPATLLCIPVIPSSIVYVDVNGWIACGYLYLCAYLLVDLPVKTFRTDEMCSLNPNKYGCIEMNEYVGGFGHWMLIIEYWYICNSYNNKQRWIWFE